MTERKCREGESWSLLPARTLYLSAAKDEEAITAVAGRLKAKGYAVKVARLAEVTEFWVLPLAPEATRLLGQWSVTCGSYYGWPRMELPAEAEDA